MPLHDVSQVTSSPPPGFEIGYDQITSNVNVTATTEATSNAIITCAAHAFDGGPVMLEFFTPFVELGTTAGASVGIVLSEGGTVICELAFVRTGSTQSGGQPLLAAMGRLRFTPTAGLHTYVIGAYTSSTTGTPLVGAGTGVSQNDVPAFVRFTKV